MIFWSLLLSMSNWFPTQYPSIWIIVVISFSNNVIFVLFFFWSPFLYLKDWFSNQYLSLSIITMTHFSDNIIFFSFFFFFFSFAFPFETLFVHNRLISSPISTNTNYCCGPLSLTMSFSLLFLLVWLHSYHFFSNNVILSFSFGRRSFSLLFMN